MRDTEDGPSVAGLATGGITDPALAHGRGISEVLVRRALFALGVLASATVLYLARGVLIPVAIALLLTFLMHPVVTWVERLRIGRVPSVLFVVALAFSVLGGIVWAFVFQLSQRFVRWRPSVPA